MQYKQQEIIEHIEPFNALYREYPIYKAIMSGKHSSLKPDCEELRNKIKGTSAYVKKAYYPLFCKNIYRLTEIPEKGNLLSLGCGFGTDEKNLAYQYTGLNIWGMDLSRAMIEAAVKNNEEYPNVRHCLAMAESLPFADNYFDRIIAREVIEHVIDPAVMTGEIARTLKPGGICVVTTPNAGSMAWGNIKKIILRPASAEGDVKDEHIGKKEALRMFKDSGLTVKEIFYDWALYSHFSETPDLLSGLIPFFERITRPLQRLPLMKELFCDQIKYVLVKAAEENAVKLNRKDAANPACPYCKKIIDAAEDEENIRCEGCGKGFLRHDGYFDFIYTKDLLEERKKNSAESPLPVRNKFFILRKMSWLLRTAFYSVLIALLLPFSLLASLTEKKQRHMKILHAPTTTGGNAFGLSHAERALGLDSDVVVYDRSPLNYKGEAKLDLSIYPKPIRALKQFGLFVKVLREYDVLHFNFGSALLGFGRFDLFGMELPLYKMAGKKIIVTYNGCDARQKGYATSNFAISPCQEADCYGGRCNTFTDDIKRRRIKRMARYADKIFTFDPDLLNVLPESAEFTPYTKPGLQDLLKSPLKKIGDTIKIVHAPSDRGAKGTRYIMPVLERIRSERGDVEIVLVEGVSNSRARDIYREADIIVEQLLLGWYSSVAVESMALGKPVVSYIRAEDMRFIPEEMRRDLPVINATPKTLYDVLKDAIGDKERLVETGRKSRAFVEKWHDPIKIAKKMKNLYERL